MYQEAHDGLLNDKKPPPGSHRMRASDPLREQGTTMTNDSDTATVLMTEDEIRKDERHRIATLLRDDVDTFASFASDKRAAVLLIALALDL